MEQKAKKKFVMPYPFILMLCIMLIVILLSYVVPSGQYERIANPNTGQLVVDPDAFSYVENENPIGFMDFFRAIHNGLVNGASVYASLLILAGVLKVVEESGALGAGIHRILSVSEGKEFLVVFLLNLAFTSLGAIGFGEGGLPFVPITITVVMALGYDRMAGAATAFLGLAIGWTSGLLNLLSTGICQNLAGLPLFSGIGIRFLGLVIFFAITITYLYRYCAKIKKDPTKSLTADEYMNQKAEISASEIIEFTGKRKLILVSLAGVLVMQAVGAVKLGWALPEIAGMYVMLFIAIILISGMSPNLACAKFTEGACTMMVVCIMIGLANGVMLLMNQGMIIDTAVHGLALALQGKSPVITLLLIFLAITVFNFFVVSGPGKAVVMMPILSPLAQLLGINQQVITLVFCYGDGITNYLYPTSGAMLAGMMLAGIDYPTWLKFFWKLALMLMAAGFAIILFADAINYGPF